MYIFEIVFELPDLCSVGFLGYAELLHELCNRFFAVFDADVHYGGLKGHLPADVDRDDVRRGGVPHRGGVPEL